MIIKYAGGLCVLMMAAAAFGQDSRVEIRPLGFKPGATKVEVVHRSSDAADKFEELVWVDKTVLVPAGGVASASVQSSSPSVPVLTLTLAEKSQRNSKRIAREAGDGSVAILKDGKILGTGRISSGQAGVLTLTGPMTDGEAKDLAAAINASSAP